MPRNPRPAPRPARLRARIAALVEAAGAPGGALGVVQDGEVIFAESYGYRDVQAGLRMEVDTRYPLASTSKAINATLLGALVDDGLLAWDASVRRYLPGFNLLDETAAATSLRDLLLMRTGLPRHDWVWFCGAKDRAALVAAMASLEPSAAFRERFQYNNLGVVAAGHAAEVVTGRDWLELVRERITDPLGMPRTGPLVPDEPNLTKSYAADEHRQVVETSWIDASATAPSGGALCSTVEDMSRWIAFNLRGGVGGANLLRETTLREIHTGQIEAGVDHGAPSDAAFYAMGWFVDQHLGTRRISHGGNLHDVNSEVTLYPEHRLGVVSFCNLGAPALARNFNTWAAEWALDLPGSEQPGHRIAQYEAKLDEFRACRDAAAKTAEAAGAEPSSPVARLVGRYRHPAYGVVEVATAGNGLQLRRDHLSVVLQPWRGAGWIATQSAQFATHLPHPFDVCNPVTFQGAGRGVAEALRIRFEPALPPIEFHRVSAAS